MSDDKWIDALEKGDAAEVTALLTGRVSLADEAIFDGDYPLHVVARTGSAPLAELLVRSGARLERRDRAGRTPLHVAATEGQPAVARVLLVAGADANASAGDGTPLEFALSSREPGGELVAALLKEWGARDTLRSIVGSMNIRKLDSLLVGRPDAVRNSPINTELLAGVVEIASVSLMMHTPDERALKKYAQARAFMLRLVAAGADPNGPVPMGCTSPIHAAAQSRTTELVEDLLAHGADPNRIDRRGRTPWHLAQNEAIREVLARHGGRA